MAVQYQEEGVLDSLFRTKDNDKIIKRTNERTNIPISALDISFLTMVTEFPTVNRQH